MKILKISQLEVSQEIPPVSFPDFDPYNVYENVNVTIDRYPNSRFWAVNVNGQLLAVVVYRKGAMAIKSVIERLARRK